MRLFFAIELGDTIRQALDHAVEPLRAAESSLAWVSANRLHLTMKFIGDADADGAAR